MDTYINLITTLVAALVGGSIAFVGVLLTNRGNTERLRVQLAHDTGKSREELIRDRGEELYELTDKWGNQILIHYINRLRVMQGKLTFNQSLDLDIQHMQGSEVNFGRIEMLIDVYFPNLRSQYDSVITCRSRANEIMYEHKLAYEEGGNEGAAFIKPFVTAQFEMEVAVKSLKSLIIEQLRYS
jgi:hypothetical protein